MSKPAGLTAGLTIAIGAGVSLAFLGSGGQAGAALAPVGLGTATSLAVLAGSTVTNTGATTVSGDLGVSPGTAVTGFPPGVVSNGTIHAADAVALQAQADLTTAYNDAAGRASSETISAASAGGRWCRACRPEQPSGSPGPSRWMPRATRAPSSSSSRPAR